MARTRLEHIQDTVRTCLMKIYKNKNKRLKIKSPKQCVFASFSLLNYVVRLSHIATKLAESKILKTTELIKIHTNRMEKISTSGVTFTLNYSSSAFPSTASFFSSWILITLQIEKSNCFLFIMLSTHTPSPCLEILNYT